MQTVAHVFRKNFSGDNLHHDYAAVTMPAIPGVKIDGDRSDTAPTQPAIRSNLVPRSPVGIALTAAAMRRVEWVRQALIEVAQEIEE